MAFENHPYPKLGAAEETVRVAEAEYQRLLEEHFPLGSLVRINHSRGSFLARVSYRDGAERRLIVRNIKTGKFTKAYPSLLNGWGTAEPRVVRMEE